jgi:hypothetical protein
MRKDTIVIAFHQPEAIDVGTVEVRRVNCQGYIHPGDAPNVPQGRHSSQEALPPTQPYTVLGDLRRSSMAPSQLYHRRNPSM